MSLGATIWLWMLAAVVIPIAIHLWSRKSGQPKMLPTFRFLPEKSVARASRIELHERGLLLLRLLLIVLITLLLVGLFVDTERGSFDSVVLSESDSNTTEHSQNGNILEVQLPKEKIDNLGWFHLINQYHYDYRPGLMVVDGALTAERFHGNLPQITADVQWNGRELTAEKELARWIGAENMVYVLQQKRSAQGVETEILPLPDTFSDSLAPLQILINSNAKTALDNGFRQAASLWNIGIEEQILAEGEVAVITYGEQSVRLTESVSPKTGQYKVAPGASFGIELSLNVAETRSFEQERQRFLRQPDDNVLEETENGDLRLNVEPEPAYAEWFYAGVAHQLLKIAVGIEETMEPELTSGQREPLDEATESGSGWVQNRSASTKLLVLLLVVWAGERFLSNRRGM